MGGSTGVNVAGAIRMARELGPGPHHRHRALRLRQPLRLEAVQPGIPALQGPAGAGMARAGGRRSTCRSRRSTDAVRDAAALPRRRLSARLRGDGRRASTSAAASCSTARSSTRRAAGSRATPAGWSSPAAASCRSRATVYGEDKVGIVHVPAAPEQPARGRACRCCAEIDWERRHRHMRMHTALHLLCSLIPFPVTGGSIGAEESRLDFDISDAGRRRQGRADGEAQRARRRRSSGHDALDHRRGARRQSGPRPHHEREAADRHRPRAARRDRRRRMRSTCSPAAARMCARPARSARVAVTKIEKKGRQNRRIRLAFAEPA